MAPAPSYSKKTLALIQSMVPQIAAAAARYGIPAEAIAGALAQEQYDQTASYENRMKAYLSSLYADRSLDAAYAWGFAKNPFNAERGASDLILGEYHANPNAITVGSDVPTKLTHPLLVDYGPAGMKFHNAIQAILKNPDDPAFAPYVKNPYAAGIALQNGGDKALMASSIAAYLRHGLQVYQANMSVDGDPTTGVSAWDSLSPERQHALLVQFYKQGPTPRRALTRKLIAAQTGIPYVPQIGVDGAGATYLANRAAITQALADAPANFADRWNANSASASRGDPVQRSQLPSFAQEPPRPDAQSSVAPLDEISQEASKRAAIRRLVRAPVGGEGKTAFDAAAPAVPFVPPAPRPSRPPTFDERFGASAGAPPASTRPLSPFSGEPMQYLPPSVFGIPDASGAPSPSLSDWFAGLTRARARQ